MIINEKFVMLHGFREEKVNFVLDSKKENVTTQKQVPRENLWIEEALDYMKNEEKLFLKIYEDLGYVLETPILKN